MSTNFPSGLLSRGIPVESSLGFMPSKCFFVDSVNGNDGNDGKTLESAVKTLPVGYALLTANKNECLIVMAGATAYSLSAQLDMSKSYTHVIGVNSPVRIGGRVRISQSAAITSGVIKVSGNGSIITGLHLQHGYTSDNTSTIGLNITGDRNFFQNCTFESPMNTTLGTGTINWAGVYFTADAQENGFDRCTFGNWTVLNGASTGANIEFAGDVAGTVIENSLLITYSSSTSHVFVEAGVNTGGESAPVIFENCIFQQLHNSATLTKAINPPTASGGRILLSHCTGYGFTDWGTASGTDIIVTMPAANEAGGIGTTPS